MAPAHTEPVHHAFHWEISATHSRQRSKPTCLHLQVPEKVRASV